MKRRRPIAKRIAARQRLLALAHDLAPFFSRPTLETVVRGRAPELVRALPARELVAVLELAARPLQAR